VNNAFKVDYVSDWDASTTTISEFIDDIWDARRTELPYMYGSYEIHTASKAN